MPDSSIQSLLILQDRDLKCDAIELQLKLIPDEIEKDQLAIQKELDALEEARNAVKEKEVQVKQLEGQVADLEDKVVKYKTQQMQVKKNEEYAALAQEISSLQQQISEIEDEELVLIEDIEESQSALVRREAEGQEKITARESHIEALKASDVNCREDLASAREAVEHAAADVPPDFRERYTFVKKQVKRPPYIVPIEASKCGGCHIKVSGEVESIARRRKELVQCDNCRRIVYWP